MTNVPKWISQMSAVALAVTSVSAIATPGGAPDFLMHQASINLKVSSQEGLDAKIDTDTIKTKELINILMRRSPDSKNEKDEKLGLVTGCDKDVDAAALVVYDKKLEIIKPLSDEIILFVQSEVVETKDGKLKKVDLLAEVFEDEGFMDVTGQIKYGKIGNKVAKDGDNKDHWDKDSNCPKTFKSKSITGVGFIGGELFIGGDVIMSGKLNASSPKFAGDFSFPGEVAAMSVIKTNDVDGDLLDPGIDGNVVIAYQVTVRNIGDIVLTGVTVNDPTLTGALVCGNDGFDGTLGLNEATFCVGDRNITGVDYAAICAAEPGIIGPGQIVNVAVANSDQTNTFGATNVITLDCFPPVNGDAMAITKNAGVNVEPNGHVVVGDVIDYAVRVTNLDLVGAQTNVVVSDLRPGAVVTCPGDTLALDEDMLCQTTLLVTPEIYAGACADHIGEIGFFGVIRNVATVTSDEQNGGSFAADEFVAIDCEVEPEVEPEPEPEPGV